MEIYSAKIRADRLQTFTEIKRIKTSQLKTFSSTHYVSMCVR